MVTPELPGHGRRAAEVAARERAAYGRAVADAMAHAGVSRAVLVGHSMGGLVIAKAAELCPQRIAHLVFLAAVVPCPTAAASRCANMTRARARRARWPQRDRPRRRHVPPPRRDRVGALDGRPAAPRPAGVAAPSPCSPRRPPAPSSSAVDLRRFYALAMPRTYIRCLQDVAVVPRAGRRQRGPPRRDGRSTWTPPTTRCSRSPRRWSVSSPVSPDRPGGTTAWTTP